MFEGLMENEMVQQGMGYAVQFWDVAKGWLLSPAAWTQFGLLIGSWFLAVIVARYVSGKLTKVLTPEPENMGIVAKIRRFLLMFLPLLLPIFAFVFTSIGEQVTQSLFGSSSVIAFGKRVFLFLAARILVKQIITEPFLNFIGRFILLPIAGLYALGLIGPVSEFLTNTIIGVGNIRFSAMAIVRGIIAGSIIFWIGMWGNQQVNGYLGKQPMRPAMKQLSIKAAEIFIFGIAFLVLMNVMGIDLSTFAVIGGAVGVGLGFGLQKIASNFISGIILLVEGQATVGDYVELDGGEQGRIIKMLARATILETFDGRWIVVPNEDFITTRVVNYSDSGSANRYEAAFSVSYDTDINLIPDIVEAAVAKHPEVLTEPEKPDCELRGFGDSGIDFAVEFWVNGIDDGSKKYTSDVLFLVWNALRDNGIEIPYPQRVVHFKGPMPS